MSFKNGKCGRGDGSGYEIFEPPSLLEINERILETLSRRKEVCERAIERAKIR